MNKKLINEMSSSSDKVETQIEDSSSGSKEKDVVANNADNPLKRRKSLGEDEEDEDEDAVTMLDVLKDEAELEEDAKRVLGGSDDKSCTFDPDPVKGIVKRQPLYSCKTCTSDNDVQPGGVCLACSYHCHEGHELVELYTKRHFRCDCGLKEKFPSNPCKLNPAKDSASLNSSNVYNQNFKGLYCVCHRPYPDPEEEIPDEMIQCILCEDWYHGRHLNLDKINVDKPPPNEDYDDLICQLCCVRYYTPLFRYYSKFLFHYQKEGSSDEIDVEKSPSKCPLKNEINDDNSFKMPEEGVGLFWIPGWRGFLCKCSDCAVLLKELKLEYLTDPEDTIAFYESKALEKTSDKDSMERGMEALSSMDRVQQVEAISSYNSMKTELMEYLKKFAQNGQVVKSEDINEFFQQKIQERKSKKPRIQLSGFCK